MGVRILRLYLNRLECSNRSSVGCVLVGWGVLFSCGVQLILGSGDYRADIMV